MKSAPDQVGTSIEVAMSDLRLDPLNPRLPSQLQGGSQEDLAVDLDLGFEAFAVAESIATHGFFRSEPLIAVPSTDEADTWIVVEGNRRLTALLGLSNPAIRAQFPDPDRWDALAAKARITDAMRVPVVVVGDRSQVVPIIGFRHIAGILAWSPFAQARYIAKLVDDDGYSIAEVSKMIGIDKTRTGNLYRDQAIAKQAAVFGIDTGPVESEFSLLTVAMSTTHLRDHVSAPLGSKLIPGEDPIPAEKEDALRELIVWIFGDDVTDPVASDSRQIPKLGKVIGNPTGLNAIRAGKSIEQAKQLIDDEGLDTVVRITKRLTTARNALRAAEEDIAEHGDLDDVLELLDEIGEALEALSSEADG